MLYGYFHLLLYIDEKVFINRKLDRVFQICLIFLKIKSYRINSFFLSNFGVIVFNHLFFSLLLIALVYNIFDLINLILFMPVLIRLVFIFLLLLSFR